MLLAEAALVEEIVLVGESTNEFGLLLTSVQESSSPDELMASLGKLLKHMLTHSKFAYHIDHACAVLTSIFKKMLEQQPLSDRCLGVLQSACMATQLLLAQARMVAGIAPFVQLSEGLGKAGACEALVKLVSVASAQDGSQPEGAQCTMLLKNLAMRVIWLLSENKVNVQQICSISS